MNYRTLNHYIIRLAGRVAGHLESETGHVVTCRAETHELDGAAARAETERPEGIGATPVDQFIEFADHHIGAGRVEFLHELINILVVLEVLTLHAFDMV